MEPVSSPEPDYAESQRQVQRWLGRCMLSLQQSERLLKALLHDSDFTAIHSGRAGEGAAAFEVSRSFERERVANMTLGGLVTAFFGGVAVDSGCSPGERIPTALPDDRLSTRYRFRWSVPSETLEALQRSMREMVDLRNGWVHHLVDRFDLIDVNGCAQALDDLQTGYEKAERFRLELLGIARHMDEARRQMSAFWASPQGRAMLLSGKVPLDGSSLLKALGSAVQSATLAEDGTVQLSEVLEKLHSMHPNEKPENYGYASWPQVIHESRAFAMVRRDAEGRKTPPRVRPSQVHRWIGDA